MTAFLIACDYGSMTAFFDVVKEWFSLCFDRKKPIFCRNVRLEGVLLHKGVLIQVI